MVLTFSALQVRCQGHRCRSRNGHVALYHTAHIAELQAIFNQVTNDGVQVSLLRLKSDVNIMSASPDCAHCFKFRNHLHAPLRSDTDVCGSPDDELGSTKHYHQTGLQSSSS
jgi:hypothetical protein